LLITVDQVIEETNKKSNGQIHGAECRISPTLSCPVPPFGIKNNGFDWLQNYGAIRLIPSLLLMEFRKITPAGRRLSTSRNFHEFFLGDFGKSIAIVAKEFKRTKNRQNHFDPGEKNVICRKSRKSARPL